MDDGYIVLSVKATGDNPFLDEVYQAGVIRYDKYHAEISRSLFSISVSKEAEYRLGKQQREEIKKNNVLPVEKACDAIANLINGKIVVMWGQLPYFDTMFRRYPYDVEFDVLDCSEYFPRVCPFFKNKTREKIVEFFRMDEVFLEDEYKGCLEIRYALEIFSKFSNGQSIHKLFPHADRFLSGYWDERVKISPFAKLFFLKNKHVLITGKFNSLSAEAVEKVVVDSDGINQKIPGKDTDIAIIGNVEFPAAYQTRAVTEVMKRIRQNQAIRIISELEFLSLLYGQTSQVKSVNRMYYPVAAKPELITVLVGNHNSKVRGGGVHVADKGKKDSSNGRSFSKKVAVDRKPFGPYNYFSGNN